ncbi:general odorant-binding protein 19a-like [Stomoxys calcitrans]|uniref:general odorant-binding protein 19a-like n=1 Tax=Stomoxys calcitrans TaxID=35570 RepID=UPI0027E22D6E|nr:general odorant-binding protein 19a-like [Stomoxys calcitrans]
MEIKNFIKKERGNRGPGVNGLKISEKNATEEQMWAADGLMRDVCLPKFLKITNETGAGIRAGTLSNDKDAKCNINYAMEMMQTVRSSKEQMKKSKKKTTQERLR